MFGENVGDLHEQKSALIFLYISGTFLINIVCLNILISVVTDNFDRVMQRIEAENCKIKAKKMLSQEIFWSYFLRFVCKKPKQTKKKFLFIARYVNFSELDVVNGEQAKFKQISMQIK